MPSHQRYLLQVYFYGARSRLEEMSGDERDAVFGQYADFFALPEVIDGGQLQPPATATTVTRSGARTVVSDGPCPSSAEPLGGYYLVEVDSLDAATELAARVPAVLMGGSVEVRPLVAR